MKSMKKKTIKKYKGVVEVEVEQESWLTISNDGITGNDQTFEDLCARIVQYYNDWKKEGPEVDIEKASNHWYKMSAEVSKFNGAYISIKDSHPSGHDEDQVISMAMTLWNSRNPTSRSFPYLHSWKILQDEPKWKEFSR
ncbi:uncharacterized protein [Spinacia oleracea]|uniref:No apical meristem-associated C-terminal domain-containing protein n=1 Tax=Spinacia oleracea TaxID=3562 RepID=A0ABM3QRH2_SPIOL|nr:uncharacterized protein LOC130461776 [Spinacia oleracea]